MIEIQDIILQNAQSHWDLPYFLGLKVNFSAHLAMLQIPMSTNFADCVQCWKWVDLVPNEALTCAKTVDSLSTPCTPASHTLSSLCVFRHFGLKIANSVQC